MTSSLDARSNLERSWLKSCQMLRKCCQNCCPRVPLGTHWRSEGLARDALGTVCTSLWRLRVALLTICKEKGYFEILMPISSRIATFARLSDQVGATWTQKSRPSGPKGPGTGKSEGPGWSSQTGLCWSYGNRPETVANHARPKSSRRSKSI